MEPGTSVFSAIVEQFGHAIVQPDGRLDRAALARLAFADGRVEELNAIVHPATIALQGELAAAIFARDPHAIVVVESALIFETAYGEGWRNRFDCLVLVTAPEDQKIARFIARSGSANPEALAAEARRRLARMIPDEQKATQCDFVLRNNGTLQQLTRQTESLWQKLTVLPKGKSSAVP
jgi:dephospho-CoA kinase